MRPPKREREAQARREMMKARHDEDLRNLMEQPAFRRFLYRLCFDTCRMLADSFTGNSETFHREGRRSVGVYMWGEASRVSPKNIVHTLSEALASEQEAALLRKAAAPASEEPEE